ncbi:MAG TPA: DinB family protein [Jatrophihabitans sp.]|jgi:hypothetical protein
MTETPAPSRPEPPYAGDEYPTLVGFLEWQRATFRMKCSGLSPEQLLQRASPPSTMCLLGLLRHLSEVEMGWFRSRFADEEVRVLYGDDDADFNVTEADEESVSVAWALYEEQVERAREIVAGAALDDLTIGTTRSGDRPSLRWILVHMIEEYARHNGHADLLREAIDGVVGE